MPANNGLPSEREASGGDAAPGAVDGCRTCQEFELAQAEADAERDYSRATDCRVLLRRHQRTPDCVRSTP